MLTTFRRSVPIWSLVAASLLFATQAESQENWSRFRGPNGSGVVPSAKLPTTWSADSYAWTSTLAGSGTSSPVVWGDRLFVTSCDTGTAELFVECFHIESGKKIWKKSFASKAYRMHRWNSFASSTPAVDASHVFVILADPEHTYLVALDHDGSEVWRRDFGKWVSQHGFGTSPMIFEDQVVLMNSQQAKQLRNGQTPGKSELISVDRKTGKDHWRRELVTDKACYSVPCVQVVDGKPRLIGCSTGEGFFAVDPGNGVILENNRSFKMRTVASPVVADGLMYGSNGSGGGGNYLVAGRFENQEFQTAFEVTRNANYVSTPIVVEGLLFLFGDKGVASCVDAKSGQVYWRERMSSGFTGSPVANSEQIYIVDSTGKAHVIKTSKEFELLATVDLGEPTRATPAIVGDHIYFRTNRKLFALGSAGD